MGTYETSTRYSFRSLPTFNQESCLAAEKEERRRERQRADPAARDFNSPSVASTDSSARETTPSEWVLVPQSTWLTSSSWPEMPLVTTRRPESSRDISNSPSVTTR